MFDIIAETYSIDINILVNILTYENFKTNEGNDLTLAPPST